MRHLQLEHGTALFVVFLQMIQNFLYWSTLVNDCCCENFLISSKFENCLLSRLEKRNASDLQNHLSFVLPSPLNLFNDKPAHFKCYQLSHMSQQIQFCFSFIINEHFLHLKTLQ